MWVRYCFFLGECIQNNTEDREQVSSSCRSRSRDRDLADSRTTNSSKYGTRYVRYQTNTITAPQNESDNRVFRMRKVENGSSRAMAHENSTQQ